jgi:hypothetical protein
MKFSLVYYEVFPERAEPELGPVLDIEADNMKQARENYIARIFPQLWMTKELNKSVYTHIFNHISIDDEDL